MRTINHSSQKTKVDIVIIGGGIAGLWALNRLKQAGFSAILLEAHALGAGQTLKSQGIIHGGLKYALQGLLSQASDTISTMPSRWKDCLEGRGEIDLRRVKCLSSAQYLWSTGSLGSEMMSFFAAKTLSSRVKKLKIQDFPTVLKHPEFKGQVYQLSEIVLDTPSLIESLAKAYMNFIYKVDSEKGIELQIDPKDSNKILSLKMNNDEKHLTLEADRFLFTAGEAARPFLAKLKNPPELQTRPLHMVLVKFPISELQETSHSVDNFFAHCIDAGINPRMTITSHQTQGGKTVWYLGGQIAEDGVKRSQEDQQIFARQELNKLFPWLDFRKTEISSFFLNRAEAKQADGKRPDSFFLKECGNALIAWPTKLALAPLLTDKILESLEQANIHPSGNKSNKSAEDETEEKALIGWPHPKIALPPWEEF